MRIHDIFKKIFFLGFFTLLFISVLHLNISLEKNSSNEYPVQNSLLIPSITSNSNSSLFEMNNSENSDYPVFKHTLDDSLPVIMNQEWIRQTSSKFNTSFDGSGIKIAILDSGIDYSHPDFFFLNGSSKIVANASFVASETSIFDFFGHGTHVASIASGTGKTSNFTYVGVAPNASLLIAKVLDNTGSGSVNDIVAGIEWAVDQGADIISMSFGAPDTSSYPELEDAINLAYNNNVTLVASAGNNGPHPFTVNIPGAYPDVLTVGATNNTGHITSFSSSGPVSSSFDLKPDIGAPGYMITAGATNSSQTGVYYVSHSGTSMATPMVTGAVALLKQIHPSWSPKELKSVLMSTATYQRNVTQYGAGILNITKALSANLSLTQGSLSWGRGTNHELENRVKMVSLTNIGLEDQIIDILVEYQTNDSLIVNFNLSSSQLFFLSGETNLLKISLESLIPTELTNITEISGRFVLLVNQNTNYSLPFYFIFTPIDITPPRFSWVSSDYDLFNAPPVLFTNLTLPIILTLYEPVNVTFYGRYDVNAVFTNVPLLKIHVQSGRHSILLSLDPIPEGYFQLIISIDDLGDHHVSELIYGILSARTPELTVIPNPALNNNSLISTFDITISASERGKVWWTIDNFTYNTTYTSNGVSLDLNGTLNSVIESGNQVPGFKRIIVYFNDSYGNSTVSWTLNYILDSFEPDIYNVMYFRNSLNIIEFKIQANDVYDLTLSTDLLVNFGFLFTNISYSSLISKENLTWIDSKYNESINMYIGSIEIPKEVLYAEFFYYGANVSDLLNKSDIELFRHQMPSYSIPLPESTSSIEYTNDYISNSNSIAASYPSTSLTNNSSTYNITTDVNTHPANLDIISILISLSSLFLIRKARIKAKKLRRSNNEH